MSAMLYAVAERLRPTFVGSQPHLLELEQDRNQQGGSYGLQKRVRHQNTAKALKTCMLASHVPVHAHMCIYVQGWATPAVQLACLGACCLDACCLACKGLRMPECVRAAATPGAHVYAYGHVRMFAHLRVHARVLAAVCMHVCACRAEHAVKCKHMRMYACSCVPMHVTTTCSTPLTAKARRFGMRMRACSCACASVHVHARTMSVCA